MSEKTLIVYSRTVPCPDCERARQLLQENAVPYTEIMIDLDAEARARVEAWTGFRAVPTLVVARPGEVLPMADPLPLESGRSPRGVDRGTLITEPDMINLRRWLVVHGFLAAG